MYPRYVAFPLTVWLVFVFHTVSGQDQRFSFHISDQHHLPVGFAALQLCSIPDSTIKKADMTDSNGYISFLLDTSHQYSLRITAAGYKSLTRTLRTDDTSLSLILETAGNALQEVVVRSTRQMITQDEDKTVVDPEQLAAASANAYEILEKTPGLFVDQDGNIYLNSTTPAIVYINGREMKMSRSDIATMLKSLPPGAVLKIEIMRTPSSKYDASGSGGIVNVVLKKGVKLGLNGSANAGFQQGSLGNQFAGFNISDMDGKNSRYLNLNYGRQNNYTKLGTDRQIAADTLLRQNSYTSYPGTASYLGYGISREQNDKWTLGYDGRISYNQGTSETYNNNVLRKISGADIGNSLTTLNNKNKSLLLDQEFSAAHKIDTAGSEWISNLSYTYSGSGSSQDYKTMSLLPAFDGDGDVSSRRHVVTGQTDLTRKLAHQFSLESGLKSSYLSFTNDAVYYNSTATDRVADLSRTNRYRYTENINAAYVQGSKTMGTFILKTGLRMENTNMSGVQTKPADTSFNVCRTDLFPYVYFSKKVMTIAGYELRAYLVYRRTITRPSYEQLNPFPRYVDQFMSEIGNPGLKPQFTQNYEFNVSVGDHPLIAAGFNDTKDLFTNVFYQADSTRSQAYRGYDNIGSNKEFYVRGFAAIPPGKKYFGVVGGQYNRNVYDGLYQGDPLHFIGESWLFYTYHQLHLDSRSTFTLNGFWRLAGPLQFYELTAMASLNMSLNRKFFNKKLTVTVNTTDMLYTNNNYFTVKQGAVNASGSRFTDSRRVGLNIRYEFGIRKKEEQPSMFDVGSGQ